MASNTYSAIHKWIVRLFGPAKSYSCMFCAGTRGSKKIEWANISGEYRRESQDWTTLCSCCHNHFDDVYEKRKEKRRKYKTSKETKRKISLALKAFHASENNGGI